jgi:hypothetical protein
MGKSREVLRTDPGAAANPAAPRALDPARLGEALTNLTERRRKRARAFSVLTLVPQVILGMRLHPAEHALVERVLGESLRSDDAYCAMDDDSYVVLLNGTTDDLAATVAHRLAQQLLTRSASVQRRIWHTGVATFPRDARTEAALVKIAREAALKARTSAVKRRR